MLSRETVHAMVRAGELSREDLRQWLRIMTDSADSATRLARAEFAELQRAARRADEASHHRAATRAATVDAMVRANLELSNREELLELLAELDATVDVNA